MWCVVHVLTKMFADLSGVSSGGNAKKSSDSKTSSGPSEGLSGGRGGKRREEIVVLSEVDAHGRPLSLSYVGHMNDREKAQRDRFVHESKKADFATGEREKYFADDDNMSLDDMVRREKLSSK